MIDRTTILCIRHGESTFNAAWREKAIDPLHFDARLSARGHEQVREAREALARYPVELVLVSLLTRALETAVGLFRGHPSAPPFEVVPLLRERVENSCDVGRPPADLAGEFRELGFAHLPPVWWHAQGQADARGIHVEPELVVQGRVAAFRELLRGRNERVIAVVGHGTFMWHLTGKVLANCEVAQVDPVEF
jgi:broad specificity phosphatase PhoE